MNRRLLKFVTLTILFILISRSKGFCFNVIAQVDRNTISMTDSIVLSVIFKDGKGNADISAITDFSIVSQSNSSNISIINGKYSKSITSVYSLIPKRTGTLRIPPLKVEHDNNIYTTQEIIIEVSTEATNRKEKDSKDIFIESGISGTSLFTGQQAVYQLRFYSAVKLSNASLQPPSFKGFTAKEAGERKSYTETINGRPYYVTEINYVIIPETAGKIEIDRAVIICDVPVMRNNRNTFPDPFDDPFFSNNGIFSFGRNETRQFSTDPITVQVEPLPPYPLKSYSGRHSSNSSSGTSAVDLSDNVPFSGLVGNFLIEANLDNFKLKIGDSATLTITISGKGNIMDAKAPSVLIPTQFKVYDDSPEELIQLTLEGYSGKKVFKKAIVPIKSGQYTIKPIILSFFNFSTHKYETIQTNPITVEVENSSEQKQQMGVDNATSNTYQNQISNKEDLNSNNKMVVKKKRVEFTGKDILSIKEDDSVLMDRKELSFTIFLSLFFLPYLLFFLFKFSIRVGKKDIVISEIMSKKAKMSLKAASESLNGQNFKIGLINSENREKGKIDKREIYKDGFFKLLHDALTAMVISKSDLKTKYINGLTEDFGLIEKSITRYKKHHNITIPAITSDEVTKILTDAGSNSEVTGEVVKLLNEIESSRYGVEKNAPNYHKQLFERVQTIFRTLAGVAIAFISTIMFGAFLLSICPEKGYANQSANSKSGIIFLEGVKAYHNGDFLTAANKFSAIVQGENVLYNKNKYGFADKNKDNLCDKKQDGVKNPYLYYNIGNAYIKAGDVGRAILWYERAKIKIPLDPDLRFNLDYARGFVTDKIEGISSREDGDLTTGVDIAELIFFWKDYFSPQIIQYGAITLSFIFFIYSGLRVFYRKKIFTTVGFVIFIALITAFCTSIYSYYNLCSNHFAIVISKEAPVRSGNSKYATKLFILHSGTKVKVQDIKGYYMKIIFSKDKIGWVSLTDAETI